MDCIYVFFTFLLSGKNDEDNMITKNKYTLLHQDRPAHSTAAVVIVLVDTHFKPLFLFLYAGFRQQQGER